ALFGGGDEQEAAAPPPDPCADIAAFIRSQADLVSGKFGGSLFNMVAGRKGSSLDIKPTDTLGADFSQNPDRFRDFKEDFANRYRPTPALQSAVEKFAADGAIETGAIDGTTLHFLKSTQGPAHCTSFLFFDLHPKNFGQLIAQTPGNLAANPNSQLC